MHPDLEDFLQSTFDPVSPTSPAIGRVVLKPDYEADLNPADSDKLKQQLIESLHEKQPGVHFEPSSEYDVLKRYILQITLEHNRVPDSPWVQVAPAGEWI